MNELIDSATSYSDPTSRNYRILIASIFADRLAFYGLRAVIVLYAVINLKIEQETVLYYYGFYMFVSALSAIIGGIICDLLSRPKTFLITGVSLCIIGSLLSLIPDQLILLTGIVLLLIGSGLYRVSSFSYIGHISLYRPKTLERRLIGKIGVINLGAFLSSLSVGFIGDEFGYHYSLIIVAALYIVSLVFLLQLDHLSVLSQFLEKLPKTRLIPKTGNIKFVILTALGVSFVWFVYELFGHVRFSPTVQHDLNFLGFMLPEALIYFIAGIFTIILFVPYYFFAHKIPLNIKLVIGLIMIGTAWIYSEANLSSGSVILGWIPVLLFGLIEGLFDLLVVSSILTFICRYSPKKYFGTIVGIYILFCVVTMKLGTYFAANRNEHNVLIVTSIILIGVITFLVLVPKELKHREEQANQEGKNIV
jgi:POT family proton-dependent oligopeptide transporter